MNSNKGLGIKMLNDVAGTSTVYVDQKKLLEDIKFMILTPKFSVLGNPAYGSDVRTMLFKQGTQVALDLISSSVYDVLNQFSGVTVLNVSSNLTPDQRLIVVKYDIIYNAVKVSNDLLISTEV